MKTDQICPNIFMCTVVSNTCLLLITLLYMFTSSSSYNVYGQPFFLTNTLPHARSLLIPFCLILLLLNSLSNSIVTVDCYICVWFRMIIMSGVIIGGLAHVGGAACGHALCERTSMCCEVFREHHNLG